MQIRLPEPSAEEREHSALLLELLRRHISEHGAIPFAQYMERCLYAPGLGYYSAGKTKFGAAGDFITAPELGELFARCIARLMAPVLAHLGEQAEVLELGAGSGAFAEVALLAMQELGRLPRAYVILEPSADLRQRQRQRLSETLPADLFERVTWLEQPPQRSWDGLVFANEVIDALPVTRFAVRDGEVYEEYVGLDEEDGLVRLDRPAEDALRGAVRELEHALGQPFADGYRSELLPQLPYWIQAIAGSLRAGMLLFVDYGYVRREFYLAARSEGTLMAHYRHRAHNDPFYFPGLNDLTASVDFTALAEAGRHAGFELAAYLPQTALLLGAGIQTVFEDAYLAAPDEGKRHHLAQQVKKLTLPDQMGERFQAMLLTRGIDAAALFKDLCDASQARRL